ncbi:MAG: methylated-DNA--[protein]-cysteine S-methyltransferase [Thermodesulfobacteriota bacterium]
MISSGRRQDEGGKTIFKVTGIETLYYASFRSSLLGDVFIASTDRGVYAVDFLTSERSFLRELRKRFKGQILKDHRKNREVMNQLKKYLSGQLKDFDCALDLRGTRFEKKVWSFLRKIPYGQTRSYKEVAEAIGYPKAFRAVGLANAHNPIPLIIPCHRVIESNGALGGFGHGKKVKKKLLYFETAHGF